MESGPEYSSNTALETVDKLIDTVIANDPPGQTWQFLIQQILVLKG